MGDKVFLIAEIGVNHNGDLSLAKATIDAIATSGVDAVKFQTFVPEALVVANTSKAEYQQTTSGDSQLEMLKSLALPLEDFFELKQYAESCGLVFMTTAFDEPSLKTLEKLAPPYLKMPSGELTNLPFIIDHARLNKPIIISTGMGSLEEIGRAIACVYWGRFHQGYPSSVDALMTEWHNRSTNAALEVTLLHCTSSYPAPAESVNMTAMQTMAAHFELPVGYSDHTEGNVASMLAIGMGASVIEKHVTLDKSLEGPDHKASMSPDECRAWVDACRMAERMLGNGQKQAQTAEADVKSVARKSLVAKYPIAVGDVFTTENVTIKRPGSHQPPENLFTLLGKTAQRSYQSNDFIDD